MKLVEESFHYHTAIYLYPNTLFYYHILLYWCNSPAIICTLTRLQMKHNTYQEGEARRQGDRENKRPGLAINK